MPAAIVRRWTLGSRAVIAASSTARLNFATPEPRYSIVAICCLAVGAKRPSLFDYFFPVANRQRRLEDLSLTKAVDPAAPDDSLIELAVRTSRCGELARPQALCWSKMGRRPVILVLRQIGSSPAFPYRRALCPQTRTNSNEVQADWSALFDPLRVHRPLLDYRLQDRVQLATLSIARGQ
jgi:hypothetical protein